MCLCQCVVPFKPQILAQVQRSSTKRRQPHSKTWCARLSIRVTCSDSKVLRLTLKRNELRFGLTLPENAWRLARFDQARFLKAS